jgi:hypothetical protein
MLDRPDLGLTDVELEDLSVIQESGLFDEDWYYRNHPDVAATKISGIAHYVKHGASEGRNPTRFFDTNRYRKLKNAAIPPWQNPFAHYILYGSEDDLFDRGMLPAFSAKSLRTAVKRLSLLPIYSDEDYLRLNRDITNADVVPASHALVYGFPEGRAVFDKAAVARGLGRLARATATTPPAVAAPVSDGPPPAVGVCCNSLGNGFIREIAADLVASLVAAGIDARLLDQDAAIDDRPATCVIMAPHEFFHLGAGRDWARDDIIRQSFMFNTEQPQTIWFERGVPFMLMSLGVIDICSQIADMFAQTGMPGLHFNPEIAPPAAWLRPDDQDHPMVRVLPKAARATPRPQAGFAERPIDISFFGGTSSHRETFFVRNARFLADHDCYLYYRRFEGPHTDSKRDGVLSRLAGHVTAHSKISLNIHRDDYGFFEWHRIVKLAMAGGSVVVSEPCLPHPLYKPGVHFFEETGRHMPDLLDWLLKTEDGRARAEQVRTAALGVGTDTAIHARHHALLRAFITAHSVRPA